VSDLGQAVSTVVRHCLGVGAGETVLVIADPDRAELGAALMDGARAAGGDAMLAILPPDPARGTEPPAPIAAAFAAADVFVAPCLPSLSHTSARKRASEAGVGTNDRATLTGNILEDEKILGTAHVAFGASAAIGGTVTVPVHLDVVVLQPSLSIGRTQVLDGGRFLL